MEHNYTMALTKEEQKAYIEMMDQWRKVIERQGNKGEVCDALMDMIEASFINGINFKEWTMKNDNHSGTRNLSEQLKNSREKLGTDSQRDGYPKKHCAPYNQAGIYGKLTEISPFPAKSDSIYDSYLNNTGGATSPFGTEAGSGRVSGSNEDEGGSGSVAG